MSKPITDTLHHIGDGGFISLASEKLAELVQRVNEFGGSGNISMIISVKKSTRGGAMHVSGTIKLKNPKEVPMEALLFAMDDGGLTPDNPHQKKLDLRVMVNKETGELIQLNEGK